MSLGLLAGVRRQTGNYASAEDTVPRSRCHRSQALSRDHLEVAKDLNNLGVLLWETGKLEGSDSAYRKRCSPSAAGSSMPTIPICS